MAARKAGTNVRIDVKDGVIWMVNFVAARTFLPLPLAKPLHDRAAYSFNVAMLEEAFPEISTVEKHKGDLAAFVLFFEPPSLDPRIINQFGLFSFLNRPDILLNEWLGGSLRREESGGIAPGHRIPLPRRRRRSEPPGSASRSRRAA